MSNIVVWLKSLAVPARRQVARRVGTSEAYLRQVSSGHRHASADLELKLRGVQAEGSLFDEVCCPTCGSSVAGVHARGE